MREIVSPISGIRSPFGQRREVSLLALYAANGLNPSLVIDAKTPRYFLDGVQSDLASVVTHSRASGATYLDSTGTLQTAASGEIRDQAYTYVDGVLTGPYLLTEPESTNLIPDSGTIEQKDVHVTPQEYTLSFLSGNAFRSEINQTLADTAVDVFVYDTSKDSDGGAWATSYPAQMVIVAEASSIKVYDGTEPTLPLHSTLDFTGYTVTSLSAVSGALSVGTTAGLATFNLADGDTTVALDYTTSTTPAIVNNTVNDVAMTVLPDAPIDPATGLPVPTIAVATKGGVSVIRANGDVWDITASAGNVWSGVDFDADRKIVAYHKSLKELYVIDVPSADYDISTGSDHTLYDETTSPAAFVTNDFAGSGETLPAALGNGFAYYRNELGGGEGLAVIDDGMVAYTTSTYNTGWLPGDIRGAFLADTDDTDLVGGELVTNGTFDTDTTGWTAFGGATLAVVAGELEVIGVTATTIQGATQAITTVVGKTYILAADLTGTLSPNRYLRVGTTSGGGEIAALNQSTLVAGQNSITFVATTTTTYVSVAVFDAAQVQKFDNISVKLADADRSVNNNPLTVNGTVTRTPVATGAELVAYSRFTNNNYLEQPYNPALDFGTGDFCVMGWVNVGVDAWGIIVDRYTGSSGRFSLGYTPSGSDVVAEFYINEYRHQGTTLLGSTWRHVTLVRSGGVASLYVDGVLDASFSRPEDVTSNTSAPLIIGKRYDNVQQADQLASFALLRISATAPTAEQIAKIYEDEKVLFQDNAACTLYGASDAVTALAHDPDTGLLHVGTSAGRSVFDGLRRIDNTTDAVTTAISASGGMIAEQ